MSTSPKPKPTPKINTDTAVVILRSTKKYKRGAVLQTSQAVSLIENGQARLATPRDATIAGKDFPPVAFDTPKPPKSEITDKK